MSRLVRFSNNAVSRLAANITSSGTSVSLTPGDGAKFPSLSGSEFFMATLVKSDGTTEIVKVTARSTDTLTVTRAAEAVAGVTASYAFTAGDRIEQRLTAKAIGDELDRLDLIAITGVSNKSADYTVTVTDVTTLIRVDTTAGDKVVTLPEISTLTADFDVTVSKVTGDAHIVTIVRAGSSDTINGANNYVLNSQWQSAWLIADRATGTWTAINSDANGASIQIDDFTGDGTADPLTLSGEPGSKNNTDMFIGGIYQNKDTYSVIGTQLTPGGVIPLGVDVEVRWAQPVKSNVMVQKEELSKATGIDQGSTIVGYKGSTVFDRLSLEVWVEDFGAVADWNGTDGTDNSAAWQAAANYLFANGGGTIRFKGKQRIATTLNLAGTGTTGRFGNTPIRIQGSGLPQAFDTGDWATIGGDWIIGQTNNWVIDATGLQYFECSNFGIRGTGTNASKGGILSARSTVVKFAHSHKIDRCTIWIDSAPTFTAVGSIAWANNGSETCMVDGSWFIADAPLTLTFFNSTDLNLVSPYATICEELGFISSTMMDFKNTTFQAITSYAVRLQGTQNISFDTCIFTKFDAGNTTIAGINLVAGKSGNAHNQDIRITGQVEQFDRAMRIDDSQIWNVNLDVMMPSPAAAYISCGSAVMNNCDFNVHNVYGSTVHPCIEASSPAQFNGGRIITYAGGSVTENTNLVTNGAELVGANVDLTGDLGLGAGSTYMSRGISGIKTVNAAGTAIVPNGANNSTAAASPRVPTSYLGIDGIVRLSGEFVPNGATTIAAGDVAGTVASAHRPDRECDAVVYVSGVLGYARVLANGQIYFGIPVTEGQAANIDGISYKLRNS